MSLRTDLLSIVDAVRAVTGPDALDQRPHQLTIRTRTWSGARLKQGTATDVDLVLPQKFRIKDVSLAEVMSSGGMVEMGDIKVEHITPSNGVVGYTADQLKPPVTTQNVERIYILTGGPMEGEYSLADLKLDRPYSYQLTLRKSITTP